MPVSAQAAVAKREDTIVLGARTVAGESSGTGATRCDGKGDGRRVVVDDVARAVLDGHQGLWAQCGIDGARTGSRRGGLKEDQLGRGAIRGRGWWVRVEDHRGHGRVHGPVRHRQGPLLRLVLTLGGRGSRDEARSVPVQHRGARDRELARQVEDRRNGRRGGAVRRVPEEVVGGVLHVRDRLGAGGPDGRLPVHQFTLVRRVGERRGKARQQGNSGDAENDDGKEHLNERVARLGPVLFGPRLGASLGRVPHRSTPRNMASP